MLHILLVEDNAGDVLMVREAIRAASIEADVITAYDGEQAEHILEHKRPDLVVLDLNLPKVNGFQLLERFRGREGPPIFVLTSSQNPADEKRARELGAGDYVVKPFGFDAFIEAVGAAMKRWIEQADSAAAQFSETATLENATLPPSSPPSKPSCAPPALSTEPA